MKCPICGKESNYILSEHLRRGTGIVYYCEECNHGMLQSSYDAEKYYNEDYRKKFKDMISDETIEETPQELFEMRKNYQQERVELISPFYDLNKSFLEIGCSAGQFLNQIIGKFGKISGVELSEKCAEYVREKWGLDIFTKPIGTFEMPRYDYIAFFQVLEHIDDPVSFMYSVHKSLNKNGRIFVEIPNLDDPLRKLWNAPTYEKFYYHEAHLNYFSEKSIYKLMEQCGFEIENIVFLQDYNILNHLWWNFNDMPQNSCSTGLDLPNIVFRKDDERSLEAGKRINKLLVKFNEEYISVLQEYKLTSNMFIIAKKRD